MLLCSSILLLSKNNWCWAPVAHTCNLRYSGGRDQEDCGSKPAPANSLQELILKKPMTKKGLVEWLKVKVLSSNPSTEKKKKSERKRKEVAIYGRVILWFMYILGFVHSSWLITPIAFISYMTTIIQFKFLVICLCFLK
jgi:hypothetical protein